MHFYTYAFHACWFLPVSFVLGENCKVVCIFCKMEFKMESGIERKSDSESLKRKLSIKVNESNLTGLRELGKKLKTIQRDAFRKKFGNLLGLLEVEVQVPVLTALAQYYDPPLRCFTFSNFQLVPTIEEFEQILDLPLEGKVPYKHLEQNASVPVLARLMKIHPAELEGRIVSRKGAKGFPQKFLEAYLRQLADKKNWETFMDVLAMVIYGVLLFPNIEYFVDYAAVDVFVASKTRSENPVTAILADVFGTLNLCSERKKGKMLCCLPMLYVWLTSRVGERVSSVSCPVERALQHGLEVKGSQDWKQFFAALTEEKIRWHLPWQQRSHLIYYCGKYPNVPLIGSKCCINYNPVLAQRQFGYPIRGSPTPAALTPLLEYYENGLATDTLKQVRTAWGHVIRMEKDSRLWTLDREVPYRRWVIERVDKIKLPFKVITPLDEERMRDTEPEEVKLLKEEIQKQKAKVAKVAEDLQILCHDYVDLKKDYEERVKAHEELMRKQRAEKDYTFRIKQDLAAANAELTKRAQERNVVSSAERQWKNLYENIKKEKQEALEQLRELQIVVNGMEQQAKDMMETYEERVNYEHWQRIEVEEKLQTVMDQAEGFMAEREKVAEYWKSCFSQLASLANGAIDDVPRMLSNAESSLKFYNPPEDVTVFIEHCKQLVGVMKGFIARARG